MTKLINMKGVVALAMALSFCVYSIAPTLDNSTIVSKPMTSYEAQNIEGSALPVALPVIAYAIKIVVPLIVADLALIGVMALVYVGLEASKK